MKSYQEMLNDLSECLKNGKFIYKDNIIIGDNSSGKSDVLKIMMQKDEQKKYYFIGAVNRSFEVEQVGEEPVENVSYSDEINRNRLKEENFNYRDSFYYLGVPRAVEDFYANYQFELKKMMNEFLDISFDIRLGEVGWEVYIDETEVALSSGYQALLRIFIEILYMESTRKEGTVIIDEIDEFLSVKNSGKIFDFLRKKFPMLDFIVTTHSADLIANTENANLILLHHENFEVLDAGDFASISQVYDIFSTVFEEKQRKTQKQRIDDQLRVLLNNKMSGIWNEESTRWLQKLKNQELTKAQKLIVRQIETW